MLKRTDYVSVESWVLSNTPYHSAPSGVNVNNNYDYDNENIGVVALRKSCCFPR